MTDREKQIVRMLRETIKRDGFENKMEDEELLRMTQNTLMQARVELLMAVDNFSRLVIEEIQGRPYSDR